MRPLRLVALAAITSLGACTDADYAPGPSDSSVPPVARADAPPPTPTPEDVDARLQPYGLTTEDAYGPASAALPEGAQLVDVATFQKTLATKPKLASATRAAKAEKAAAQQEKDDDATIAMFLAAHPDPELAARFDATPTLDAHTRLRADGDLDVDVQTTAGMETFVTIGRRGRRHAIAEAIRKAGTRTNREALYAYARSLVPAGEVEAFPDVSASTTDAELESRLALVAKWAAEANRHAYFDRLTGYTVEAGCLDEDSGGAPTGIATSFVHDSNGLWARASWPDKAATTCVKHQGTKRGTCGAFALASALERKELLRTGRKLDLSEQHLYAAFKSHDDDWRDGVHLEPLTNTLALQGYVVPLENAWRYNRSESTRPTPAEPFHGACVGYDGVCTSTTHQAPLQCSMIEGFNFCAWTPPPGAPSSGVHAVAESPIEALMFALVPDSLSLAILSARAGRRQLVVGLTMDDAFDAANRSSAGIVADKTGGDRGGHALHVVGYVANSSLPATIPPGSGGGYLIMKNSWGRSAGDQGYLYMPVDRLRKTLLEMVIL